MTEALTRASLPEDLAPMHLQWGALSYCQSHYEKAQEHFSTALSFAEKFHVSPKTTAFIAETRHWEGNVFEAMGHYVLGLANRFGSA